MCRIKTIYYDDYCRLIRKVFKLNFTNHNKQMYMCIYETGSNHFEYSFLLYLDSQHHITIV